MYVAILGRQPALGMAELERRFGADSVDWFSAGSAVVEAPLLDIETLGGSQKAGRVVLETGGDWQAVSRAVVSRYSRHWAARSGKITLGLSVYGLKVPAREVQKTGLALKAGLKKTGVSLRLVPNQTPALSTAVSHHNKLGLSANKVELIIVGGNNGRVLVAESTGAQNITRLARRDQNRPRRDAFIGMLPPKLALMMVNLAAGQLIDAPGRAPASFSGSRDVVQSAPADETVRSRLTLLDPFCGSGVVLQEAALLGFDVYGTDISARMVDYARVNLDWLKSSFHVGFDAKLHVADARSAVWQPPIDLVASETYLGQPFSAPPSAAKLAQVRAGCDRIVTDFLSNIGRQLAPGTPLCLAVPAWRDAAGNFTRLTLTGKLERLGFRIIKLRTVSPDQLVYYRENQIVARELLLLEKL